MKRSGPGELTYETKGETKTFVGKKDFFEMTYSPLKRKTFVRKNVFLEMTYSLLKTKSHLPLVAIFTRLQLLRH